MITTLQYDIQSEKRKIEIQKSQSMLYVCVCVCMHACMCAKNSSSFMSSYVTPKHWPHLLFCATDEMKENREIYTEEGIYLLVTHQNQVNLFVLSHVKVPPSLNPRPSHCLSLIACSMQKRRGEAWYIFITWMTSVSTLVDREGEGSWMRMHMFFILKQEQYVFHFINVRNSSAWGRNYKIRKASSLFFFSFFFSFFFLIGDPSPPLST